MGVQYLTLSSTLFNTKNMAKSRYLSGFNNPNIESSLKLHI
jgi:hypothetical protein